MRHSHRQSTRKQRQADPESETEQNLDFDWLSHVEPISGRTPKTNSGICEYTKLVSSSATTLRLTSPVMKSFRDLDIGSLYEMIVSGTLPLRLCPPRLTQSY